MKAAEIRPTITMVSTGMAASFERMHSMASFRPAALIWINIDLRHLSPLIWIKAYALVARGGVLWAYMGAPEVQPPLPEWEFAMVPAEQRSVSKRRRSAIGCGGWKAGSTPAMCLSYIAARSISIRCSRTKSNQYNLSDARPVFEVIESAGGLYIGARRNPRTAIITGVSPNGSCRPSP
jgi:hypothetical protein